MPSRPPPPTAEQLQTYADGFNASLTLRSFGTTLSFPEGRLVRAVLPIQPQHRGGLGTAAVNGAVLSGLFDLTIGCTAALIDPSRRSATMQLSISFERPAEGDAIVAEAWIDRAGGSTLFASAVIRNGAGEVCARSQGVVKLSSLPWQNGGTPRIN